MRLIVKQNGQDFKEFQFEKGPIYIGRHTHSQVCLPEGAVSRQHAVLFTNDDGQWVVEDLDSANKTYLNDEEVHKTKIKTGDSLRITDFTIEIDLDLEDTIKNNTEMEAEKSTHLEDTITLHRGPQIIVRELDSEQAPPIRFPAERAKDFLHLIGQSHNARDIDELLLALLDTTSKQFDAGHVWCALRDQPAGPMTCHAGKSRNGQTLDLNDVKLSDRINEAVEKQRFLLFIFSRIPGQAEEGQLRSALIAPIICSDGCFGVLYVDNAIGDDHYSLSDLDYLMLLGMHTAATLRNL